uniref:Uncharacterized protein n=1 Tax=Anguilla anguilla TaxID=7936 RepID=A0A0E9S802_ANGAN
MLNLREFGFFNYAGFPLVISSCGAASQQDLLCHGNIHPPETHFNVITDTTQYKLLKNNLTTTMHETHL